MVMVAVVVLLINASGGNGSSSGNDGSAAQVWLHSSTGVVQRCKAHNLFQPAGV